MGDYLLKGYKMLGDCCDVCGVSAVDCYFYLWRWWCTDNVEEEWYNVCLVSPDYSSAGQTAKKLLCFMSGAGLWCWQRQSWYTHRTFNGLHHCSSQFVLVVNFMCSCSCVPISFSFSSKCTGSIVPGERKATGLPAHCAVPCLWTKRRPQQQQQQQCKWVSPSAQTRALRGCSCRRESPAASTHCPYSSRSSLHHNHYTRSSPSLSTEHCPPTCVRRSWGSCSNQTPLGHHPATELSLPGGEYPALQPHHQLCQFTAQPQGAQPVTIMDWLQPWNYGTLFLFATVLEYWLRFAAFAASLLDWVPV